MRRKIAKVGSGEHASTRLIKSAAAAPPSRPALASPHDPLLQRRYQDLTRKHFGGLIDRLFAEFTGLHFHVAWAPSQPRDWTATALPTGCAVCRQLAGTRVKTEAFCRSCGPRHLARTLGADGQGHCFNCQLGVCNYWFAIRVRGVTVGIAYLQALDDKEPTLPTRKRPACAGTRVLSRAEFRQAGRLLRLIVQHVQTLDLAELRKADLACAKQVVTALENEQTRLRKELRRLIATTARTPHAVEPENHTEQVVHAALAIVNQRYSQPLTLKQCARSLRLNAAYLSALFSRAVGVPFKAYLTELRLQKSKELLADPNRNVSEVAGAVGYASENRFRIAFKNATGLAPRTWRETFHAAG